MKDEGSQRSPSSPPIGGRNEDSSLFSLDALKRTEEEAIKKERSREDSGLIDLKALAALEQQGSSKPASLDVGVVDIVAPADLFAIAAPVAQVTSAPISVGPVVVADEVAKPGRGKLYLAIGAIIAVAAAAGIFVTMQSGDAPAPPTVAAVAPTAAAAPATAAPATPTAAPEDPKSAAVTPGEHPSGEHPSGEHPGATPTATAVTGAGPTKPAVAAGPRPGLAKPPPAAKEDPPAAPAPKPADACDLACQMQRAVNKKQ